jgi:hypothetical protein
MQTGPVDIGLLVPMRKADIPLSAIDFHCSTIADDLQQADYLAGVAAALCLVIAGAISDHLQFAAAQRIVLCLQEEQILEAGRQVVDDDTGGLLQGVDDAFRKVLPANLSRSYRCFTRTALLKQDDASRPEERTYWQA